MLFLAIHVLSALSRVSSRIDFSQNGSQNIFQVASKKGKITNGDLISTKKMRKNNKSKKVKKTHQMSESSESYEASDEKLPDQTKGDILLPVYPEYYPEEYSEMSEHLVLPLQYLTYKEPDFQPRREILALPWKEDSSTEENSKGPLAIANVPATTVVEPIEKEQITSEESEESGECEIAGVYTSSRTPTDSSSADISNESDSELRHSGRFALRTTSHTPSRTSSPSSVGSLSSPESISSGSENSSKKGSVTEKEQGDFRLSWCNNEITMEEILKRADVLKSILDANNKFMSEYQEYMRENRLTKKDLRTIRVAQNAIKRLVRQLKSDLKEQCDCTIADEDLAAAIDELTVLTTEGIKALINMSREMKREVEKQKEDPNESDDNKKM